MAIVALSDQDGVLRSISDLPPTHYIVKIQSFSLLAKNNIDKYNSGEFEAGGYKWKLAIYPSGKNGNEYLSVYLAIAEAPSSRPGWEVLAIFRLFLLDQNNNNYLTLEASSGKGRRFHGLKQEWGFDQFIHQKSFNDSGNGYLKDDSCVFGAEVFICKETSKGKAECLNMIKSPFASKHTWKIENFWVLDNVCHDSKTFTGGDHKWKIQLYPNGKGNGMGSHLSLYLALADVTSISSGSTILVEFILRILDLVHAKHDVGKAKHWFSASNQVRGWQRFMSLDYFYQPKNGYLIKDSCWVEAEVTILGVTNAL